MQRRSLGAQGLVFGGLMAALVVVLALIPGLAFLMPIPLVLVFMRHGGRVAVLTAIVAVLLTMSFRGVVNGILAIPSGVLPGMIFGLGFRRNWRPLTIGLSAIAVFFVGFAMSYVVMRLALFDGRDPIEMAVQEPTFTQLWSTVIDGMEQAASRQQPASPTPEQEKAAQDFQKLLGEMRGNPVGIYWSLLPAAVFLGGAVSTWFNWLLFRWTLPRFGHKIPEPAPFERFTLPLWLVWIYGILSFAAPYVMGPSVVEASWVAKLVLNVASPLGLIFWLAGIAVAYGFLVRKQNVKPGVAALILLAVFMLLGMMGYQLFIILAMWDAIFDFRGLGHGMWKRPEEST
ncbi:MAG: DUF2232 domain-containing protein [Bacillota bacterium]